MPKFVDLWAESAMGNKKVSLSKNPEAMFSLVSLQILGKNRPKIKATVVEDNLKSLIRAGSRQALELNGPILLQLATGRRGRPAQRVLFPPKKTALRRGDNVKRPENNVITFPKRRHTRPEEMLKNSSVIETNPVVARLESRVAILESLIESMEGRLEAQGRMTESMRRTWRETKGLTPESSNLPTV